MNLPELWAGKKNGKWLERTNFKKAPPQFLVRETKNIRTCGLSDMEKIFYIRSKLKSQGSLFFTEQNNFNKHIDNQTRLA